MQIGRLDEVFRYAYWKTSFTLSLTIMAATSMPDAHACAKTCVTLIPHDISVAIGEALC